MSADDASTAQIQSKNDMADVAPTAPSQPAATRMRPRLNLGALGGPGAERKRGKSMFGIVLGTLNKAKVEDKERNASEAAKKRQLIEQRLQLRLRKETDSVRRAEEAKKEKTLANRKEEDLQLKDSIYKLRRKRLPLLANFLSTADVIPSEDSSLPPADPLATIPRTHPPPLYYLPAVLTPAQEAFLAKRKAAVVEATENEWNLFKQEREAGITEINELRQKVTDEEARQKTEREAMDTDAPAPPNKSSTTTDAKDAEPSTEQPQEHKDSAMDVDDAPPTTAAADRPESEKKDEPAMQADDDDAVEY